jgi:hypothetical protein
MQVRADVESCRERLRFRNKTSSKLCCRSLRDLRPVRSKVRLIEEDICVRT